MDGLCELAACTFVLKEISITNFRNFDALRVQLDEHVNVLVGHNGQGKTNFLEAIYYLALLRSFRTSQITDMRQWKRDFFRLDCVCKRHEQPEMRLGVHYGNDRRLLINGNNVYRASEFVNNFICVTFIPQDKELVRGSESIRRRFLDIAISQMSPVYLKNLQAYMEALKSRNAMLKDQFKYNQATITAYDQVLVQKGVAVEVERRSFVEKLNAALVEKAKLLVDEGHTMTVRYLSGIGSLLQSTDEDEAGLTAKFHESLRKHYARDCREGYTHCGPHRSEMTCMLDKTLLSHYGSEGECRITSLALKFACLEILKNTMTADDITLLVDDVVGELDSSRQDHFYRELLNSGQIVLAGTFLPMCLIGKARVFDVVGGKLSLRS